MGERAGSRRFVLTPIGPSDQSLLDVLAPILSERFHAHVEISRATPVPEDAYHPSRQQHQPTLLLDLLVRGMRRDTERGLGVTDVDLFVPELNFVFGEADARRGVAVFSTHRLHTPDRTRFIHRAATEAIHELAHTYGLGHCGKHGCVMWFSNTLGETDRKGIDFCAAHAKELVDALAATSRS